MTKYLAKPILGLMTAVFPVFIAACYGVPYSVGDDWDDDPDDDEYSLTSIAGRVLSALTGSGIPYIRVTCLRSQGDVLEDCEDTYSRPENGSFELWLPEGVHCAQLRFDDLDGEDNGAYATLLMDFENTGEDVVAELDLVE
jgi:hypothetical protein